MDPQPTPSPSRAPSPLDALYLESLKAIGKTLGQMNLYKVGHPAVTAMMQEALRLISQILAQAPGGQVAFVLDHDKLVANGRIIGTLIQVPNPIVTLFNRFKLNSMIFKAGVTETELTTLCEMAAMRPEVAKTIKADAHLAQNNVIHIALNEAIYAKVDKAGADDAAPAPVVAAAPASAPKIPPGESVKLTLEALAQNTIEKSIEALVRSALTDPNDQAAVFKLVLQQLQQEIEAKVRQATETLRREKTVVENEQIRTGAVLSNMAEGVVVVDDQGKVLMMNPAAEELYGVKLGEIAGKPLADTLKEEHMVALSSEMAIPQTHAIKGQVDLKGKDDTRRTLRASTAIVQNEAGKPVGMVSSLSDVTKHKEFEKMEREFVAHVTHELRAPLASIRAALEILQSQIRLKEDETRIFDTALRNADRLEDLIRGILDFSKIEAGQMKVHPKPVDADRIARDGAEGLKPWCMKKGIQLNIQIEQGLPNVQADHPRSVQVLVNLLSNAIKFTPAGGQITVRAGLGKRDMEKFVVYCVEDTGPGIAKADQAKIFEKFVQIAAGEKHVGGTGLGLSIAKALIHLQNGQLWLDSDAGKGSRFYFTLPIFIAPREAADAPTPPPPLPWWKKLLWIKK